MKVFQNVPVWGAVGVGRGGWQGNQGSGHVQLSVLRTLDLGHGRPLKVFTSGVKLRFMFLKAHSDCQVENELKWDRMLFRKLLQ